MAQTGTAVQHAPVAAAVQGGVRGGTAHTQTEANVSNRHRDIVRAHERFGRAHHHKHQPNSIETAVCGPKLPELWLGTVQEEL